MKKKQLQICDCVFGFVCKLLTFIRIKWVQTSTKTCKLKEQKRELWHLKHYSQNLSFTVPQFNILLWEEWRTFVLSDTLKWEVCLRLGKDFCVWVCLYLSHDSNGSFSLGLGNSVLYQIVHVLIIKQAD